MRMLQVKARPSTLAKALSELGRIIKTLHILRYIDDRPFRRRILFQLNRQELRHKLGRRVHHGDRGEIRSPLRQGQEEQLGVLGLALTRSEERRVGQECVTTCRYRRSPKP